MKVLYANPVFLDYRLPFYKRLVELFEGNFFVMYSVTRYHLFGREKLCNRIKETLGENAIPFEGEVIYNTYEKSTRKFNVERGTQIPFTKGLIRRIKQLRPDVLITEGFFQWTPLVLLYSIIFRVPVFMGYERTMHTERNSGLIRRMHRKLTDFFIKGYLVNGTETKRYLLSIGVKPKKIHFVGMSADSTGLLNAINKFPKKEKDDFKAEFVNCEKGLLYLFCGQIVVRKGLSYLLSAWMVHKKKYPNDHLVVVGKGDLLDVFLAKYNNESTISFEGGVDYDLVYRYYAIADIFVLPTLEDNWSLVIPEAMSCGLPVATSIYNGCHPELVKEGCNGITFDTYKQETIVSALDYFHHHNLSELGKCSIELEKEFNTENCAIREYEAIKSIFYE